CGCEGQDARGNTGSRACLIGVGCLTSAFDPRTGQAAIRRFAIFRLLACRQLWPVNEGKRLLGTRSYPWPFAERQLSAGFVRTAVNTGTVLANLEPSTLSPRSDGADVSACSRWWALVTADFTSALKRGALFTSLGEEGAQRICLATRTSRFG